MGHRDVGRPKRRWEVDFWRFRYDRNRSYGSPWWWRWCFSLPELLGFVFLYSQTGSGARPASCTMGTGGPFPGSNRGRGMTLTTHPHLVPKSRMSRSYTSSSYKRHHGV
jgi:hypothetical protein